MAFWPRPIALINRSIGSAGLTVRRAIPYGTHPRQRLDIYAPARPSGRLPVIVFFYGGSWQSGERMEYVFIAAVLARRGFVVAVPDYRVYPEVKYPDFLHDCAAAVAWVFAHAASHHGDPEQLFLLGHSAGAYNAVMLALAPGLLAQAHRLAGVIGLSGPYDFLPLRDGTLKTIFANPAGFEATQPITHASGEAAPMLLERFPDLLIAVVNHTNPVYAEKAAVYAPRVRLWGFVSDEALHALYTEATVVWYPSRYEGFGLPVVEAMACGASVVASNSSSIPEIAGEAATLVDPADARAHVDAISGLLTDALAREQFAVAGRARAAKFTWAKCADELKRDFDALV